MQKLFRTVNFSDFKAIFAKKKFNFLLFLNTTKIGRNHDVFSAKNHYKIAKKRPISIKLIVLNKSDFVIFKTP